MFRARNIQRLEPMNWLRSHPRIACTLRRWLLGDVRPAACCGKSYGIDDEHANAQIVRVNVDKAVLNIVGMQKLTAVNF